MDINWNKLDKFYFYGKLIDVKEKVISYKNKGASSLKLYTYYIAICNELGDNEQIKILIKEIETKQKIDTHNNVDYLCQKAKFCLNTDKLQDGLKYLEKALSKKDLKATKKALLNKEKSRYFAISGQYKKQLQELETAYKFFREEYPFLPIHIMDNFSSKKILKIENEKDILALADIFEHLGYYLGNTHQPKTSARLHGLTLEIRTELFKDNPNHFLIVRSLNNVGYCHRKNQEYINSLEKHKEALKRLKHNKLTEKNFHYFARIASNIGISLMELGDFNEAIKKFEEAEKIRKRFYGTNHRFIGKVNINLAKCYRKLGKIDKALQLLEKAEKIFKSLYGNDIHPTIAKIYDAIGYCYLIAKNFVDAKTSYTNGIRILYKIIKNGETSENMTLAQLRCHLGETYRQIAKQSKHTEKREENFQMALKCQEEALRLTKESQNYEHNKEKENGEATTYYNLGMIYFDKEEYRIAKGYFLSSRNIYQENLETSDPRIAKVNNRLGETFIKLKRYESGVICFYSAKAVYHEGYGQLEFKDEDHRRNKFLAIFKSEEQEKTFFRDLNRDYLDTFAGLILCSYELFVQGEEGFNEAFFLNLFTEYCNYLEDSIDLMIESYRPEPVRNRFTRKSKDYYAIAIKIACELAGMLNTGNKEYHQLAYEMMEKSKNGILAYRFMELQKEKLKIDEKILQRIERFTSSKIELEKKIRREKNQIQLKKLIKRQNEVEQELNKAKAKLKKKHEEYYNLKFNRRPVPYEKLQTQIRSTSAVLSYFIADDCILINVIRHDKCYVQQEKVSKETFNTIKNEYNKAMLNVRIPQFKEYSYQLYCWLIKPILRHLEGVNDLVIIPDESMQMFSFLALISEEPSHDNFRHFPYLIKDYTILYHYSVWYFERNIGKLTDKSLYDLFAIGLSKFPKEEQLNEFFKAEDTINALMKVSEKASNIACLNDKATKANFLKYANKSRIIVIYTHGVHEKGKGSYLVFSKKHGANDVEEHRLTIEEFSNKIALNNTDIVILCCCGSEPEDYEVGVGVSAFNKAALNVGAKAVIYANGELSEYVARDFIIHFYQNLKKCGRRKAFQLAVLELIKNYNMKYWALLGMMGSWKENH